MEKMNDEDGFVLLKNFFSKDRLNELSSVILDLYVMQAMKIDAYHDDVAALLLKQLPESYKLGMILELMEAKDKEALYQVQKMLPVSEARNIFFCEFRDLLADILSTRRSRLFLEGPALFVNRPNTDRLLYKWHSEAHYYPKRRRFLNIWFPLFTDKSSYNGAMQFVVGSHKMEWPFSEYKGYNKDSENKANHFVQLEIPECLVKGRKIHVCDSSVGDLYLFNRNLVHRSMANNSSDYSFAVVARAWVAEDDLTLSGRMDATPYSNDIGRAGLLVSA